MPNIILHAITILKDLIKISMTKIYILNAQSYMINCTKNIILLHILENSFKEGKDKGKKAGENGKDDVTLDGLNRVNKLLDPKCRVNIYQFIIFYFLGCFRRYLLFECSQIIFQVDKE